MLTLHIILILTAIALLVINSQLFFMPVEFSTFYTDDGEYIITKLQFKKEKIRPFKEKESGLFYIPYFTNSIFYGRTVFKKERITPCLCEEITYDYDGYEEIDQTKIKEIFKEIIG